MINYDFSFLNETLKKYTTFSNIVVVQVYDLTD